MNADATATDAAPRRWIVSARFDGFFFYASGPLAIAIGALLLWLPPALLPCWVLFLWLIDGPHLLATWQRSYLDAQNWRQRRGLLLGSLIWLLLPLLLVAAGLLLQRPEPLWLLLAAATLWSFWHVVRQHHGLLAIYQRLGGASPAEARRDSRRLQTVLWLAFFLLLLAHPLNRSQLALPESGSILLDAISVSLALGLCALLLAMSWRLWRCHRVGKDVRPSLFALAIVAATMLFSVFVVGLREPLLVDPPTVELAFVAVAIVGGVLHGLQYLGIVIATSRRRAEGTPGNDLQTRLGLAPALAYALMLLLAFGYVLLNYARGAVPLPQLDAVDATSAAAQCWLALYWGLFFHHYWLDQQIWHPSRDARLRAELAFAGSAR